MARRGKSKRKKRLWELSKKKLPKLRIPPPKPGWAHKSPKDYDRKDNKEAVRKELEKD